MYPIRCRRVIIYSSHSNTRHVLRNVILHVYAVRSFKSQNLEGGHALIQEGHILMLICCRHSWL